jgi:hypothetical protein
MEYTTQMDAARKGIVTSQMRQVLAKEKITETSFWSGWRPGGSPFPPIKTTPL